MIGILLITHGTFGESLIQNVCHVLNKRPPLIGQLGVAAQDDPLDILRMARLLLGEVDGGHVSCRFSMLRRRRAKLRSGSASAGGLPPKNSSADWA